ncbi:MAG: Ig-like domain-containing protein [Treponema sp.]|nr:Ig-like domain-containing protein [Treponema sp.]
MNLFVTGLVLSMAGMCTALALGKSDAASDDVSPESASREPVPVVQPSGKKGSFYVESMTPQGELSSAVKFPSVQVVFSEPVVPLAKLGEPTDKSDVVTITPSVKGVFRWYGTSILSFDCADELIPQKKYTIQVNPKLTSLKGNSVSGQLTFSFQTEPLRLVYIEPGYRERTEKKIYVNSDDVLPEYARNIAVHFSAPVNPAVVSKYLHVRGKIEGEKTKTDYSFSYKAIDEKSLLISLKNELPRNCSVSVVMEKGAMPDADCVETPKEMSQSFHTLRPFVFRSAGGTAELHLSFNHSIQEGIEQAVFDALSFSPAMNISREKLELHGNTIFVHDIPVSYGDTYSVVLKGGVVRDIYGQVCDKEISEQISVPDADSFGSFRNSGCVVLESQFAPKYAFEYQNILSPSSYTLTPVCGVTDKFKLPKPKTETIAAEKADKNRRMVRSVGLSDFLESAGGEKRGAVRFEGTITYDGFSTRRKDMPEIKNDTLIQVTDLGVTVHSAWNETAVLVTSLRTGKPVANADVRILYVEPAKNGIGNQIESLTSALTGNARVLASGKTNADGLCTLAFDFTAEDYYGSGLYADVRTQNRDDRFVQRLPQSWEKRTSRMVTYIFSDRGLYRPGETVTAKVIDRSLLSGEYTSYRGNYEISFSDGAWRNAKTYATVKGKTSASGAASATWKIPEDVKPGTYFIRYTRKGGKGDGMEQTITEPITVQFFERLRFQAGAEIAPMVYTRGDSLSATVTASYLGGGALVGGSVHGDWLRSVTQFTPAGERLSGMTFGPIVYDYYWQKENEFDDFREQGDTVISDDGTAHLSVGTGSEKKTGAAYTYSLEAQVTDSGNQMIAARASALVHPAAFYIGLSGMQGIKGFAKKGEKLNFLYTLAVPEGDFPQKSQLSGAGKISYTLSRKTWQEVPFTDEYGYEQTKWEEKTITETSGEVPFPKTEKPIPLSVTPSEGGRYLLTLTTTDSAGRTAVTEYSFYVTGSQLYRRNDKESQTVDMQADKNEYEAGETAHILLTSTIPAGTYLMTVEREGLVSEKVLHLTEPTAVLDVPITEQFVPVVWVSVSSFTARTGDAPVDYDTPDAHKPQAVQGSVMLNVSKKSRSFDIAVSADKKSYRPADHATLTLTASKNGKPVSGAELTVLVTDRGVLDLIGYQVKNPIDFFYNQGLFYSRTNHTDSRFALIDPVTYGSYTTNARERRMLYYANSLMAKPMMTKRSAVMAAADMAMTEEMAVAESAMEFEDDAAGNENAVVRKDFRATAVFVPAVTTDASGKAVVDFTLPDSLTEYVVTVIGVKEHDFAYQTEPLVAANPISVRDVETRILRLDDEGEAGVVITNIGDTDEPVQIDFAVLSGLDKTGYKAGEGDIVRQNGAASVTGAKTLSKKIRSGATDTLMFRLHAEKAGWITLAFTVRAGSLHEVIYKPLEIEKPFVFETVTTVGQLNKDETTAEEQIMLPSDADEKRASLFVQLDSSRLGTLSSAVDYVFRYPYGCLEQRSSAVMPLIAFGEYIKVFGLESEVKNAKKVAAKEIASWAELQRSDGGFPYWKDARESSLAVSLRIAEIISLAKEKGISLPSKLNENHLASYIQNEIARLKKEGWWYPCAYADYVLARMGKKVSVSELESIIAEKVGVSECAFAGLAALTLGKRDLAEKAAAKIKNMMSLTARGASFQTTAPWSFWYFFNGNAERYALALHLFTALNAEDRYNTHLVYEVLEMQRTGKGRWQSTAMTSRVLIALDAYIRANKLEQTDFSAQALLNGKPFVSGKFKGIGVQPAEKTAQNEALSALPKDTPLPLVITKNGTGTLFYIASLTYALPAEQQKARDEGICVYTEITDARTGEKITADKLKSGTIYREVVHISTTKERTFVAVRAPVPAGCEILNSAFVTTATVPPTQSNANGAGTSASAKRIPWYRPRISHQDIYDAEIRCFWDYFPIGCQTFEFLFRAQRTGVYQTPAVLAECMYEPEIFGRSNGTVWHIE